MYQYLLYIWFALCANNVFSQSLIPGEICLTTGGGDELNSCYTFSFLGGQRFKICLVYSDAHGCAVRLMGGYSDFAILSSGATYLIASSLKDKVERVATFRSNLLPDDVYARRVVLIVRKNLNMKEPFTARKYCGLGIRRSLIVDIPNYRAYRSLERYLMEKAMRNMTIEELEEYSKLTSVDVELKILSQFFGNSCKPGPWAYDFSYDQELHNKTEYSGLCNSCSNVSSCTYNASTDDPYMDQLHCLFEDGGDVAYAELGKLSHFLDVNGHHVDSNAFEYFCIDKDNIPLSASHDQVCWFSRYRDPFLVRLNGSLNTPVYNMLKNINSFVGGSDFQTFTDALLNRFGHNEFHDWISDEHNETNNIWDYFDRYRSDTYILWSHWPPIRNVTLCTSSVTELEKCWWIRMAAMAQDIRPRLECDLQSNAYGKYNCINAAAKNRSFFVGITEKKDEDNANLNNLATVARQYDTVIVAIVKNGDPRVKIKNLYGLKNKTACFPEYNSKAFKALVYTLRSQYGTLEKVCPHEKAISKFFSKVCVPGFREQGDILDVGDLDLCTLCPENGCKMSKQTTFAGELGAFKCLINHGDVAFVNYPNFIISVRNQHYSFDSAEFRILCHNGTLKYLDEYKNLPPDCIYAVGSSGRFVASKENTDAEMRDMEELLSGLHYVFESNTFHEDVMVRLYGNFRGVKGLVYGASTIDVVPERVHLENKNIDYEVVLKSFEECPFSKESESDTSELIIRIIMVIAIAVIFIIFAYLLWKVIFISH